MENDTRIKNKERSRVITGLILVGVGAVLLLHNTGVFIPHWLFSWPMILILCGVYSGVKHNFQNNTWLILLAIGGFFLLDDVIPGLGIEPYFWPVLIIAVGLLFILRPKRDNQFLFGSDKKKMGDDVTSSDWQRNYTTDDSETVKINSVFSGINKKIVAKNFQGGKVSCVFGGADIDFSQAEIEGEVVLKLEVAFGGVNLIVPPHWTVYNQIEGVFHGVEDNRKFNPASDAAIGKKLILKGSVVFGGVEIRSY
jgi:hypothetical protein